MGAKLLCAQLEGASLKGCNFEDPAGSRANMEGKIEWFKVFIIMTQLGFTALPPCLTGFYPRPR